MTQKGLGQEKIEELRRLRSEGQTVREISKATGISQGSVSNYTRDIATPPRGHRRAVVKAVESPGSASSTSKVLERVPESDIVIELANQVKEAELQARLRRLQAAEEEDTQRREYNEDLRRRVKEAETREAEARARSYSSGSPEVLAQVETAKAEASRLREQLTEQRHQEQMSELRRGFEGQIGAVMELVKGGSKGRFDIMSQAIDKVDSTLVMIGSKVDSHLARSRGNNDFMMALKLGLSPDELNILKRGEETPITQAQYQILRGNKTEQEFGSFEAYTALTTQHNRQFRELSARVSQRLNSPGSTGKVSPGKTGSGPEPGPEQPTILDAETRLVTCTRCGSTFDVDLAEARLKAKPGVKLYVHCANEKCNFLLDVTELVGPVEPEGEKPTCYEEGVNGSKCNSEPRRVSPVSCGNCPWW